MDDTMIRWLNQELIRRKISARELSGRIGKSPTYVSSVLSGKIEPGLSFYVGLAEEFDMPVESIIRLAVGKPEGTNDDEPLTAKEIWQLANVLTPEERQEVLDFLDYLLHKRRDKSNEAPGNNPAIDTA